MALFRDSVAYDSDDFPKQLVVNHVLGGTFSSRLYEKLRHESGDAYSANLWRMWGGRLHGMLVLETFTRADKESVVEEKLRSALAEIHQNGITKDEVEAALAYLKGRQALANETPAHFADRWAMNRVYGRPGNVHELHLESASNLTLDEINAFIKDFYDPDRFALVKVVPEDT